MSVVVDVPIFESQVLDRNSPRRYIIQQAESYLPKGGVNSKEEIALNIAQSHLILVVD
jgi:hypothetical protein